MSGCVLNPWSTVDRKLGMARRLALRMGWKPVDDANMLSFLQSIPAEDIARAQNDLLTGKEKAIHIFYPFGPVVEPFVGEDCVVGSSPLSMCKDDSAWSYDAQVPALILGTSEEGLYLRKEVLGRRFEDVLNYIRPLIPTDLGTIDEERTEAVLRIIDFRYFRAESCPDIERELVNFMSDKWFWHGLHRTICGRIDKQRGSTFVLRFSVDLGPLNHFKTMMCGEDVPGNLKHIQFRSI